MPPPHLRGKSVTYVPGMEWKPLLDPETVNESVMARAAEKNPAAVQRLNELREIRAMHVTVAGHAVAEVKEALSGLNVVDA